MSADLGLVLGQRGPGLLGTNRGKVRTIYGI